MNKMRPPSINRLRHCSSMDLMRAYFRELMNNVKHFAVMFNSNAEIIYCNGHFLQMTGLLLDEVMGRSWTAVFSSPWASNLPISFSDWLRSQPEALHHEGDVLTRGGESYWIRWDSIPLRDAFGTIVGIVSIGEDITEHRGLQRALLDSSARER